MVRIAPVVVPGYPHHVTRRGGRRRLWITFWRRFWGVFLGDFLEATGPGASVRGVFSADGVLLVRWASANFDFFRGFFTFLGRFLPVFVPYFALFSSMSCAYLYVNNFFPASLAWELRSLQPRRAGAESAEGDSGNREPGNRRPETGKRDDGNPASSPACRGLGLRQRLPPSPRLRRTRWPTSRRTRWRAGTKAALNRVESGWGFRRGNE